MNSIPCPLMLCILDGWGEGPASKDNAIANAHTPVWDDMIATCSHTVLATSGLDVGLPDGQMGNSEVGHMNIGSGRVVMQNLPRIDQSIQDGSLAKNPALVSFIVALQKSGGACHLVGLLSPGGVHSHQDQMVALAEILVNSGIKVIVHFYSDGRDTPPKNGKGYLQKFKQDLLERNMVDSVKIATLSGRYYAMDRDQRWDRIESAYDAMVLGHGEKAATADDLFDEVYEQGKTDEFILPTVIGDYEGVQDGDGLLMANFRSDRVRQILASLVDPDFDGFARKHVISWASQRGVVEYSAHLTPLLPPLFTAISLSHVLGDVIAQQRLTQLRISETEKYAHVTFFFNGGVEDEFEGEERILIPSPSVATYDEAPSMSAQKVTDALVEVIEAGCHDVIIVNYANTDMVGHTGVYEAAKDAVEVIDHCLGQLRQSLNKVGGVMLVTADHGNAEMMYDNEGDQPHTSHTTNPVPFIVVDDHKKVGDDIALEPGRLSDIAPTMLDILGVACPEDMTGHSLILKK